jgi:xanthine phosphoribosyltransferase
MKEPVYIDGAPSHTKGGEVLLMVSPEFLGAGNRVLIVDDFLASGKTIDALARIVDNAGATLVGIAAVVEKSFEGGRELLQHWDVPIESMAIITDMTGGKITLAATE